MTALTSGAEPHKTPSATNHQHHHHTTTNGNIYRGDANQQDTQSTCEMILSGSSSDTMSTPKLLSLTMIAVTCLMGFFLLAAVYIQTNNRCVCAYGGASGSSMSAESQNAPYFEPLKALSSEETSKEIRNLPLRIRMHGDARDLMSSGSNGGRVSCEITRKTASQVIASEPKELNTPFGNITTDPKLMHLTGEKLFFTCYNGEKPKPVVLIARPRIFAIFHRPGLTDSSTNSSDSSDESSSSNNLSDTSSKDQSEYDNKSLEENKQPLPVLNGSSVAADGAETIRRNKRNAAAAAAPAMDCMCKCPAN